MLRAIAVALVLVILLCLGFARAAEAKPLPPKPKPPATWSLLLAVATEDLAYAHALALAHGTPAGEARAACWAAWAVVAGKAYSVTAGLQGLGKQPSERRVSSFEASAQVAEALRPESEFARACAPVAKAAGLNLHAFVIAVATGRGPRR